MTGNYYGKIWSVPGGGFWSTSYDKAKWGTFFQQKLESLFTKWMKIPRFTLCLGGTGLPKDWHTRQFQVSTPTQEQSSLNSARLPIKCTLATIQGVFIRELKNKTKPECNRNSCKCRIELQVESSLLIGWVGSQDFLNQLPIPNSLLRNSVLSFYYLITEWRWRKSRGGEHESVRVYIGIRTKILLASCYLEPKADS